MMDSYSDMTNPLDKEKLHDMLMTEKHLTSSYNTFANEVSSKSLHQDLLSILNEEHDAEFKIFHEMQKRGWYSVEYASDAEIQKASQNFKKMS